MIKPQDVLVCLDVALHDANRSYAEIAAHLHFSVGAVHMAVQRSIEAQLLNGDGKPILPNLLEFLTHGVRYIFATKVGRIVRGVPTGTSAPQVQEWLTMQPERALVWPDPRGNIRGHSIKPLFASVPDAARECSALYTSLALVDIIRVGSARECTVASQALAQQLNTVASISVRACSLGETDLAAG
jgi:hypothetical protein